MIKNDLLLRAARREQTERTPVWLMRQAGRCDPQYRALRERVALPLEQLFRDADLAAEISLLPRRMGVDAIILFQDILTPLGPMGTAFKFRPGPVLEAPISTASDIDRLRSYDPADRLDFVARSIRLVRQALEGDLPLLGFAGAPLTLAFFLIEGGSPGGNPRSTRAMMETRPADLHRLLGRLADMTGDYLALQVEAGVDAVQLFESVAHMVSRQEYEQFAHPYHQRVFSRLNGQVPKIMFVREQPFVDLMAESGADVLSVGQCVDLAKARQEFGDRFAFQGNVDNQLLLTGGFDEIDQAVRRCIEMGGSKGHILNLNHGLLPDTPFENVCRFIETCRSTGSDAAVG
jgi:uroporphyrinogen decarboxylase